MAAGDSNRQTLSRAPGVLWRNTMRGVLVSTPSATEPLLLTTPGDVLWSVLATRHTRDELAANLAQQFSTSAEQVRADIEPVITRLLGVGAITASPSAQ